ncbi:MAG: hypothetical protein HC888_10140 [Candidatus Competibacteraceae bacterium]|nr:hypothetical protein [Candidatus Competibacteraceae bacterium]
MATTTNPNGETFDANVLGAGIQTLHKIPVLLLDSLPQATGQLDAASQGFPPGSLFYNTTTQSVSSVSMFQVMPLNGVMNGSNKTFTLPSTSYSSIIIIKNGIVVPPTHYGISGSVLTFSDLTGTGSCSSGYFTASSGDALLNDVRGYSLVANSSNYQIENIISPTQVKLLGTATFASGAWSIGIAPLQGETLYALFA